MTNHNETRLYVGTNKEGHKFYVCIRLGPDPLNDLSRFQYTTGEQASADTLTLSMTYEEINPRRKGDNAFVGGGAGVPSIVEYVTRPAIPTARLARMAEVADRWHLNGMVAYCEHQRDWDTTAKVELVTYKLNGETLSLQRSIERAGMDNLRRTGHAEITDRDREILAMPYTITQPAEEAAPDHDFYTESGRETKTVGWLRENEHPRGILSKPCPECNYKYGTAWRVEQIPAEIVAEVRSWLVADTITERTGR